MPNWPRFTHTRFRNQAPVSNVLWPVTQVTLADSVIRNNSRCSGRDWHWQSQLGNFTVATVAVHTRDAYDFNGETERDRERGSKQS